MTLNRLFAITGFLVLFAIVSHASDLGKLVKQHASFQTAQTSTGDICRDNR